jgi:hypothetical protein
MENEIDIPKPTIGFWQKVKNFYSNYAIILFLGLSALYLLGSFYRIANHVGCSDEITAYLLQYLIVVIPPFLIVYFFIFLERGRNRLIGKDLTSGYVYSLHVFLLSIFYLVFLAINYMAFFSQSSCGKFGDEYSWFMILIVASLIYLYGGYMAIMLLTWIVRFVKRYSKKNDK